MSEQQQIELTVVARQAGVQITVVRRYVEYGLFEDRTAASPVVEPRFDERSAALVARAERLRQDLDLNYAGAVLVSELLDRIQELEGRS